MDIQKIYNERFLLEQEYGGNDRPVHRIQPLVSVSVITYQHRDFIKDCLEGILMQQTSFPFEIIIGEDESTDGTREICLDYANRYPDKIRLFLRDRKTSQLFDGNGKYICRFNGKWNRESARGRYIALCEGDDYWTDPLKLQKQVDFLEENPAYILTCGGFSSRVDGQMKITIKDNVVSPEYESEKGFSFSLEDFNKGWLTKTLTVLFRNHKQALAEVKKYRYSRDVHIYYHLLKEGKGFYFKEVFGHYNVHEGGGHSMKNRRTRLQAAYLYYGELYRNNRDAVTRQLFHRHARAYFNTLLYSQSKPGFKCLSNLAGEVIGSIRTVKELARVFLMFLPKRKVRTATQ